MAANTETVCIDTVDKAVWDQILQVAQDYRDLTPLAVDATHEEVEGVAQIALEDITAGELYAAAEAGRGLKAQMTLDDNDVVIISSISASRIDADGSIVHKFSIRGDDGTIYTTDYLIESAEVVFTPVTAEG